MLRKPLIALLTLASVPTWATTYTLEPNYTQVVFWWNHLGFSTPEFDPAAPTQTSVVVSLPLSSLHTGVPDLDSHLRSKDFFDADTFKTAVFNSSKVETGTAKDHLKVTGNLDLRGLTKPITLDVTLLGIGTNPRNQLPTIGFDATAKLKRSDFGLQRRMRITSASKRRPKRRSRPRPSAEDLSGWRRERRTRDIDRPEYVRSEQPGLRPC